MILGLPLLLSEFTIGRTAQQDAISSFKQIAPGTKWYFIGILGMVTCFILLSFYSAVGGWIITYLLKAITGGLNNLDGHQFAAVFDETISNPIISLADQFVFILLTIIVVARGLQKGIERASSIMMPA